MKMKRDIVKQLQFNGFLIFLIFALFLTFNYTYFSYLEYKFESEQMRSDFVENQKIIIKNQVTRVMSRIDFERNRVESVTKKEIKNKVYEAYNIAEVIYNQNIQNKTKDEVKKLIVEVLRNIRFNNGNGYYFVNDLDGNVVLFPTIPEYEKQNIINIQDSKGNYVIKEQTRITKEKGEGFVTGYWPKPNSALKKQGFKKISYVKLFEPYNWSIGSGQYLDDVKKRLQNKFIKSIGEIEFVKEGKLFIGNWDGLTLLGPGKGENHFHIEDKNGKKVVQELITNAKDVGGFVSYIMPNVNEESGKSKISYVLGIKEWEWYVGSGVYLDEIEDQILVLQSKLKNQIEKRLLISFLITIFILILFLVLINRFKVILKRDLDIFVSFFNKAASTNILIDRDKIKFNELDKLAENANEMLEDKILAEKILSNETLRLFESQKIAKLGSYTFDVITGNWESSEILDEIFEIDKNYNKNIEGWSKLIHPEERKNIENYLLNEVLKEHKSFDREYRIISYKRKNEKVVYGRGKLIFDETGNLLKMVGTIQDITAKKNIEKELRKAEKLRSIGTLAGGIAHDFNNILTGVYGNISLAKMVVNENHEVSKYLVESEKSMHRAIKLTKQLLTFSKGGSPIKEDVSINILLNEVIKFDLTGSNVKPILNLEKDLWDVNVDKGQISQVFSNLTINANQATPDGGNLYISSENIIIKNNKILDLDDGFYVKIIIKDEGTGIEKKYLDKIFDPYFTTKQAGNGLGLATSYSIIDRHEGKIFVDSELGKGTKFTIYLQAIISKNTDNNKENEGISNNLEIDKKNNPLKILIMDDDEAILKLASKMIEKIGHKVQISMDGNEAIKLYKKSMNSDEESISLVILDLTIPAGMGGIETVKQILDINPSAKVIVSSGYSSGKELTDYKEYGFIGMLNKPYTVKNFVEILKKVL